MTLPAGQRPVAGFPRFGTHLGRPAPVVPVDPVIEICGAVATSLSLPLAALSALPRRELTADFHCVAGWSATNLHWEGVAKHLCRIKLHTTEPTGIHTSAAMRVLQPHPRARVWREERHRYLPSWSLRAVYRLLIPPIAFFSSQGRETS